MEKPIHYRPNLFLRAVALALVGCLIVDPATATAMSYEQQAIGGVSVVSHRSLLIAQDSPFAQQAVPPHSAMERLPAAQDKAPKLRVLRLGGIWPITQPFYSAIERRIGGWVGPRVGWFAGHVAAPVILESVIAAFGSLSLWNRVVPLHAGLGLPVIAGLLGWQVLHLFYPPTAHPQTWGQRLRFAFLDERGVIGALTLAAFWATGHIVPGGLLLHLFLPLVVPHLLVNLLSPRVWAAFKNWVEWWYWRNGSTPSGHHDAVDWKFHERHLKRYETVWTPQFLIVRRTFLQQVREVIFEAGDFSYEMAAHLMLHLPGGSAKIGVIWLGRLIKHFWLNWVEREKKPEGHAEKVQEALNILKEAPSLKKRRERASHLYLRSGHIWARDALKRWEETKGTPAVVSEENGENKVNPREMLIHEMGAFLGGVLQWRGAGDEQPEDRKILNILIDQALVDPDHRVVTAAVRALGAMVNHLIDRQQLRVREVYQRHQKTHPSEVVQGAVARDLGRNFKHLSNLAVAVSALRRKRSDWVRAYLVEEIEYLAHAEPFDPEHDSARIERLWNLLRPKALNQKSNISLRENCLKTLVRIGRADWEVFELLRKALLTDPDPTIQMTAVWALDILFGAPWTAQFTSWMDLLAQFIRREHQGRPNIFLEDYTFQRLTQMINAAHDPALTERFRGTALMPHEEATNPIVFVNVDRIAASAPGHYGALSSPRVTAFNRQLHKSRFSVVITDGFRQDRDEAKMDADGRLDIQLRTDVLEQVLANLGRNLPALVPSRDPARAKRASHMERAVVPWAGRAVVVLGTAKDLAQMRLAGMNPPVIEVSPEMIATPKAYDKLTRDIAKVGEESLRETSPQAPAGSSKATPAENHARDGAA
jgi:hypothetical protein